MSKKMLLPALLCVSLMLSIPAYGQSSSIVTTDKSGYSSYDGGNPGWGETGETGYYSNYPGDYSGMQQTGYGTTFAAAGAGQQSSDSLMQYQEFYSFDQRTKAQEGPVQFDIYGAEPTYLIINGQSQPYKASYVPDNSLWIQGTTRWTQYMQCPIDAKIKLLAYSYGGPVTVVEAYSNGYQSVNNYNFYPGYTQFFFWADLVGRHTLTFYVNGRQSNSIVVDVVPNSGPYTFGTNPPSGQTSSKTVIISIGTTGQGSGQPHGNGCDITGTWNFGTNGPYNIVYAGGRIEAKNALGGEIFDSGTWNVIDASKRLYGFSWQSGWEHTFTLSVDCSTLDGSGRQNGGTVQECHGRRVTSSGSGDYSTTSTGNAGQGSGQPTSSTQPGTILSDSADAGFDPNARPILSDSQNQGFMSDVQKGEPI